MPENNPEGASWQPDFNNFMLGGHWSDGSVAGKFRLNIPDISRSYDSVWEWELGIALPFGALRYEVAKQQASKLAYPTYIPRRWIYLAAHARKARTRKKWQHEIIKNIQLYEKRNKGAKQ